MIRDVHACHGDGVEPLEAGDGAAVVGEVDACVQRRSEARVSRCMWAAFRGGAFETGDNDVWGA